MINVSLFPSYSSFEIQPSIRKLPRFGHVVDRSANGIDNHISCSPLLHHNHPHVFEIWTHAMKFPSGKSISPNFEGTLSSGEGIPRASPSGERATTAPLLGSWI